MTCSGLLLLWCLVSFFIAALGGFFVVIVDAILGLFSGIATAVVGALPSVTVPAWLSTTLPGYAATISGYLSGMGAWLPVDAVGNATGFVFACLGVALVVHVVRLVLSYLTLGGGAV